MNRDQILKEIDKATKKELKKMGIKETISGDEFQKDVNNIIKNKKKNP